MRSSAFVGRVGGLAVALGIGSGVAVGGVGVAWAAPGSSADSAGRADSASDARSTRPSVRQPSARQRGGRSARVLDQSAAPGGPAQAGNADLVEVSPVTTPVRASAAVPLPGLSTSKNEHAAVSGAVGPVASAPSQSLPDAGVVPSAEAGSPAALVMPPATAPSPAAPVLTTPVAESAAAAIVPPVMVATPRQSAAADGVVESVLAPLTGALPAAPVESAVSWVMLAAARRELGSPAAAQSTPAAAVPTGPLPDDAAPTRTATRAAIPAAAATEAVPHAVEPVAAATAGDPITAFFEQIQAFVTGVVTAITQAVNQVFQVVNQMVTAIVNIFVPVPANSAPIADSPTVSTPDSGTGVVTGVVTASDPDGDAVTYSTPASTAKGAVVIDTATGEFTYTPSDAARHGAAALNATSAGKSDSFTVTVADGNGGTTSAVVNVVISPANAAPVAGTPTVGSPDATTGVVTGSVSATDPDGDPLTFSGSTTTSKGSVVIDSDGGFTYTPTAAARHDAASEDAVAADLADSFTVTVADGHGGAASATVNVTISPANAAPVPGTPTANTNPTTGVVTGNINASDPDKDAFTYTAGFGNSAKGSVTVSATGDYTYTPTNAARHAAARDGAAVEDQTDTFVVDVTDSYGAVSSITFSIPISPANTAPQASITSLSDPDPSTGIVTGNVTVSDADGDDVYYSVPTSTAKGSIAYTPDGDFTYTPTADARNAAADPNATAADMTDTFTVTFTDDFGGTTGVPVTVPISPKAIVIVTAAFDRYTYSVDEGDSGISTTPLTVKLSAPPTETVTVSCKVEATGLSPLATANVDFVAETGTLVFAPGQTTETLPLKIYGDTTYEDNEYLHVVLTGATGAILSLDGTTSQYLSIKNDDAPSAAATATVRV